MAGCYHDKQDLKSDLNIEIAREGDILEFGQDLKDRKCEKNPGHRDFIPFKDLTLEDIPIEHRDREIFDRIKMKGKAVVKLVVNKIENGESITVFGSGWVKKDEKGLYLIKTNNHVVKTDDEVQNCTVEFNYDDDDDDSVEESKGVKLTETYPYHDISYFKFDPIPPFLHQLDWKLGLIPPSIVIMYKDNDIVTKSIGIYRESPLKFECTKNINNPFNYLMFISNHDGSNSYFKSSYFKFRPIPPIQFIFSFVISNIQQTSIDVHIDEDDGNSRVIPGDVVRFDDEFVVKLSKSIFQDEVKKCRLVWSNGVISRGTRLHFQQVDVSEFYSGLELEIHREQGIENLSIFEIYPIPRYTENLLQTKPSNDMCCIGHPHGGIKMITFGRYLGVDEERFDTKYQRITNPGQNCQCKTVSCIKYSCKTCPGSSGSPVFLLNQAINIDRNYCHFMGESVERRLNNGELLENLNMAWRHHKTQKQLGLQ